MKKVSTIVSVKSSQNFLSLDTRLVY